jgi:uncharacterized protein YfdQ (DUF2303 family)
VSADPTTSTTLQQPIAAELAGLDPETTAAEILLRAGAALARPVAPAFGPGEAEPYAIVPDGHTLTKLGDLIPVYPRRIRQVVTLSDVLSFVVYVARFADKSASLIYAQEDKLTATAILDHPKLFSPDWGQHRAILTLRETLAWQAWRAADKKRFDQVAFAEFVENHLPDIASPDGASLLEMVQQLDIRKAVSFESSIRLTNGQVQLTYVENVSGTQAKSTATIPETFVLGLAPFEGADVYKVTARLRYRLADGKVALWFELLRPEDVIRAAWQSVVERIGQGCGVPVLAGLPPVAA